MDQPIVIYTFKLFILVIGETLHIWPYNSFSCDPSTFTLTNSRIYRFIES